jgi:hypothetical protein
VVRTHKSLPHSTSHRSPFCVAQYILLLIPHRQCQHHVLHRNPL